MESSFLPIGPLTRLIQSGSWSQGGEFFRLELSSRSRGYLRPVRVVLMGICVILLGLIGWSVARTAGLHYDLRSVQARLDQVREQDRQLIDLAGKEGVDLSAAALQRLPAEVALANEMLTKRSFSWTQFLAELEEAIPARMAIKSVRFDPGSAVVQLKGAAFTVEDVTALAFKLQNHPVFRDPVLGQHHAGTDGLVEFDLSLTYHPQKA